LAIITPARMATWPWATRRAARVIMPLDQRSRTA
jgi:hypothetical protein